MKKFKVYSEIIYLLGIISLALSINIMDKAKLGLSMIVSPAYIISEKFSYLSYGQAEYIIEFIVFILFCMIMKKFRITYLSSFITGIAYGACADLFKLFIPYFSSSLIPSMPVRILLFMIGMLLSAIAISLFYSTYFYPQIYDFFVDRVSKKYHISLAKFKTTYDFIFLFISILLSYSLFHKLIGIHIGTLVMALFNGTLINYFKNLINKYIDCIPIFDKLYSVLSNN